MVSIFFISLGVQEIGSKWKRIVFVLCVFSLVTLVVNCCRKKLPGHVLNFLKICDHSFTCSGFELFPCKVSGAREATVPPAIHY